MQTDGCQSLKRMCPDQIFLIEFAFVSSVAICKCVIRMAVAAHLGEIP